MNDTTTTWAATESGAYNGNGRRIDTPDDDLRQGQWGGGRLGDKCGLVVFTGGAHTSTNPDHVGLTVREACLGMELVSSSVVMTMWHTYFWDGAYVNVSFGVYESVPDVLPDPVFTPQVVVDELWVVGESRWVDGPSASRAPTSVRVGPYGSDERRGYCILFGAGSTHAPRLRLTYRRAGS